MKQVGDALKMSEKICRNNQIITASRIKVRLYEMTMNEKLTMIGLTSEYRKTLMIVYIFYLIPFNF